MTTLSPAAPPVVEEDLELMYSHSPRCESQHRSKTDDSFGPCTVDVVARWSATCPRGRSLNVCQRAVDFVLGVLKTERHCSGCGRLARECWTLILI